MKHLSINVDFKDPMKEIKDKLQRDGARNIDIRRNYNGDMEVRYSIKCSNPENDITKALEQNGAKSVRSSTSYNGARFECQLDDIIDEREFKRKITDVLRRMGFRAN